MHSYIIPLWGEDPKWNRRWTCNGTAWPWDWPSMNTSSKRGNNQKWILKDVEGRIFGPFSTEQVFQQIERGFVQGGEMIALYPGGAWIAVSSAPEFYDRLLDVLSKEVRIAAENNAVSDDTQPGPGQRSETNDESENRASREEVTSVTPVPQIQTPAPSFKENTKIKAIAPPLGFEGTRTSRGTKTVSVPAIEVADVRQLESLEKKQASGRNGKLPFLFIGLALLLGLVAVLLVPPDGSKNTVGRVRLLAPRKNQNELPEAKITEKFRRALGAFQNDTFSGYQRAENEMVEVVEGAPDRAEVAAKKAEWLATLCMTYRELWPFSYQDSTDLRTVNAVMQEAKRLDPGGANGATCEIVQLMLSGRFNDAQGLAESMLAEDAQAPVLYEIRGDIFAYNADFTNAQSYFAQARQLWPAWQKTAIQEARAQARRNHFAEAIELYEQVLKKVPTHAVAKIELALIEGQQFSHFDQAFELLNRALKGEERVPRHEESKAELGLAQIYERRDQMKKALEFAQKAYASDSSNLEAKGMIVRLAGEGELKNTKVAGQDMIYLGDQYVRSGDCFSAQAQYKAAFEAEPKNGMAAMKAGKCLWDLNQSSEAIEWLKKAIAADPQLTPAYVQLAEDYAARYDYQAATQVLKKIQSLQPNSYEVFRGFASVELKRNNFAGAVGFAQRALKLYENDNETMIIMAKALAGQQNFVEAKRAAARALELDSSNIEAQSMYGKIEAGLKGVDAGAAYIQLLIGRYIISVGQQVPPAAIAYRITLGEIFMQDERYTQAEDVFKQAIALDRDNKKALLNLGKVIQAEGRVAEALETYLKAAVLDPSDANPIFMSGLLYEDAGKLTEAYKQFDRVLKINPLYPRAHVELGRVYLRQGEAKKALDEAMQERVANPDLSETYTLAAESYFVLKQYANCAAEYQQASRRTRSSGILVRMARCYRLSGALDSAESLLRQAQAIESGNPDLYKEQGAIFHVKGLADEAITAYNQYLRLAPNAPDRSDVESRIRRIESGDMLLNE